MEIVDLTHPLRDGLDVYPGDPGVSLKTFREVADGGYHLSLLTTGLHIGTHLDAPRHVFDEGAGVDRLDLRRLVGPARVVDVAGETIAASSVDLDLDGLEPGARLLFRTGWSSRFGTPDYFGHYPDLDLELARELVAREVALVGLEQPSVHGTLHREVHEVLLEREVAIVEGLANLDRLPREVFLACLPLPFAGADGSPCRAVAWARD
jgi:kynurenine formamidase